MKTYIQPTEMAQQEYFDRLHQQRALEVLAQAKKMQRPSRFLPHHISGLGRSLQELKHFGRTINNNN